MVPPDPKLLEIRGRYFEEAYDHLSFWTSAHLAEEAEQEYFAGVGNKQHMDENRMDPGASR